METLFHLVWTVVGLILCYVLWTVNNHVENKEEREQTEFEHCFDDYEDEFEFDEDEDFDDEDDDEIDPSNQFGIDKDDPADWWKYQKKDENKSNE